MKALIHNNRVVDISETTFEVHSDAFWIDASDNVRTGWECVDGVFKEPESPKLNYKQLRSLSYPQLVDFADAYYWAQQGDNTKMNEYLAKITEIKDKYPKVTDAS